MPSTDKTFLRTHNAPAIYPAGIDAGEQALDQESWAPVSAVKLIARKLNDPLRLYLQNEANTSVAAAKLAESIS